MLENINNTNSHVPASGAGNAPQTSRAGGSSVSHHIGQPPVVQDRLTYFLSFGRPALLLDGRSIRLSEQAAAQLRSSPLAPSNGSRVPVGIDIANGTVDLNIEGFSLPNILDPNDSGSGHEESSVAAFVRSYGMRISGRSQASTADIFARQSPPATTAQAQDMVVTSPGFTAIQGAADRHNAARGNALQLLRQHGIVIGINAQEVKLEDIGFLQCGPVSAPGGRRYMLTHQGSGAVQVLGTGLGAELAKQLKDMSEAAAVLANAVGTAPGQPRFVSQVSYTQTLSDRFVPSANSCGALSLAHLIGVEPDWLAVRTDAALRLYDSAHWTMRRNGGVPGHDIQDALREIDRRGVNLDDLHAILQRLEIPARIACVDNANIPGMLEQFPGLAAYAAQDATSGELTLDWDAACPYLCANELGDGGIFVQQGGRNHLVTLVRNAAGQPFNMDSKLAAPQPLAMMLQVLLPEMQAQRNSDGGFTMLYLEPGRALPVGRQVASTALNASIMAEARQRFDTAFNIPELGDGVPAHLNSQTQAGLDPRMGTGVQASTSAPVQSRRDGPNRWLDLPAETVEAILGQAAIPGNTESAALRQLAKLQRVDKHFQMRVTNFLASPTNLDIALTDSGLRTVFLANEAGLLDAQFQTAVENLFAGRTAIDVNLGQVRTDERRQIVLDVLSRTTNLTTLNLVMHRAPASVQPMLAALPLIGNLNPGLERFSVDMSHNIIGADGAQVLAGVAGLTSLALRGTTLDVAGTTALARHRTLTSLDVSFNFLGGTGASPLAASASITNLNLSNNNIQDVDIIAFARNRTLVSLDLSVNRLTAIAAGAFSQGRTTLRSLNIAGNDVGNIGAGHLSRTSITELNISYNGIGGQGVRQLSGMASLRVLDVSNNAILQANNVWSHVDGLSAGTLQGLPLVSLTISNNRLGDAGVQLFTQHPTLAFLDARNNRVDDAVKRAMQRDSSIATVLL